mmetsp:Transcript_20235/g.49643  ORF Transcript_20235/g.49643 Transcript_20235/m.49643 type:complete len:81 (+) Transcript_20235:1-243(+)
MGWNGWMDGWMGWMGWDGSADGDDGGGDDGLAASLTPSRCYVTIILEGVWRSVRVPCCTSLGEAGRARGERRGGGEVRRR